MKIELLTIFPEMFESFLSASIIGRAREAGLLDIHATDIRPYSQNKHKNTDDYPFGGGAGMLMLAQPIADAMKAVTRPPFQGKRIYMSPRGVPLTQALAQQLSQEERLVILCGHYEGVDQRVLDKYIDMEISVGDYVLTGGETAAMVKFPPWPLSMPSRASSPACSATRSASPTRAIGTAFWNIRSIRGRACSRIWRCPRCCSTAITKRSASGGASRRCWPRRACAPISWLQQALRLPSAAGFPSS